MAFSKGTIGFRSAILFSSLLFTQINAQSNAQAEIKYYKGMLLLAEARLETQHLRQRNAARLRLHEKESWQVYDRKVQEEFKIDSLEQKAYYQAISHFETVIELLVRSKRELYNSSAQHGTLLVQKARQQLIMLYYQLGIFEKSVYHSNQFLEGESNLAEQMMAWFYLVHTQTFQMHHKGEGRQIITAQRNQAVYLYLQLRYGKNSSEFNYIDKQLGGILSKNQTAFSHGREGYKKIDDKEAIKAAFEDWQVRDFRPYFIHFNALERFDRRASRNRSRLSLSNYQTARSVRAKSMEYLKNTIIKDQESVTHTSFLKEQSERIAFSEIREKSRINALKYLSRSLYHLDQTNLQDPSIKNLYKHVVLHWIKLNTLQHPTQLLSGYLPFLDSELDDDIRERHGVEVMAMGWAKEIKRLRFLNTESKMIANSETRMLNVLRKKHPELSLEKIEPSLLNEANSASHRGKIVLTQMRASFHGSWRQDQIAMNPAGSQLYQDYHLARANLVRGKHKEAQSLLRQTCIKILLSDCYNAWALSLLRQGKFDLAKKKAGFALDLAANGIHLNNWIFFVRNQPVVKPRYLWRSALLFERKNSAIWLNYLQWLQRDSQKHASEIENIKKLLKSLLQDDELYSAYRKAGFRIDLEVKGLIKQYGGFIYEGFIFLDSRSEELELQANLNRGHFSHSSEKSVTGLFYRIRFSNENKLSVYVLNPGINAHKLKLNFKIKGLQITMKPATIEIPAGAEAKIFFGLAGKTKPGLYQGEIDLLDEKDQRLDSTAASIYIGNNITFRRFINEKPIISFQSYWYQRHYWFPVDSMRHGRSLPITRDKALEEKFKNQSVRSGLF